MFNFNIRGENIEVTDGIKDYVKNRLERLVKLFPSEVNEASAINVNLKFYSRKQAKAEVTIMIHSLVLRAEETTEDLYKSIDFVFEKLEIQIRKFKSKINSKRRTKGSKEDINIEDNEPKEDLSIVRTKRLSLKPMDCEEAILQMDLLEHDFFIFEDSQTNGTSIVYRRQDGKYGLIETDE